MDYEKIHKLSLELGRKLIQENPDLREWVESKLPELAESEDERMLREFNDWLCEEIECRTNDLPDEKDRRTLNMLCYILTKVKDWLEKQKEQVMDETDKIAAAYQLGRSDERKQKEQKPVEWSEEDEKILNACIEEVGSMHIRDDVQVLRNWLKYLRPKPHWKPNEEQMGALHCCVMYHTDNLALFNPLASLYKELKKL